MTDDAVRGEAFGRAYLADPTLRASLMAAIATRDAFETATGAKAAAGVIDFEAFATGVLDAASEGFDDDDRIELTEAASDLYHAEDEDEDLARARSLSVGLGGDAA